MTEISFKLLEYSSCTHYLNNFDKYIVGVWKKLKAELQLILKFSCWGCGGLNLNHNIDFLMYSPVQNSSDFPVCEVFIVISQFMKQNYVSLST